jgi:tRNA-uridine 2-sulfurtransferase
LHSINFSKEYWEHVFSYFLEEYRAGRTPNPDILCNKEIKFKVFLQYAKQLGAQFLATGHYAQISKVNGQFQLVKGLDPQKDQSYFLHALNQEQLSQSLFPIGQLEKTVVRELAKKAGLPTHTKKDSVGICFIGERKFKAFLNEYLPAQPGEMETTEGRVIGQHDGLMFYTLGQRQGLKIGGMKDQEEAPWYVVRKDINRNVLVVAQGDHAELYKKSLTAERVHWINSPPKDGHIKMSAKTRYRQPDQACTVELTDHERYKVTFNEMQRAVTPGQSVVFYQDNICLGGGVIIE